MKEVQEIIKNVKERNFKPIYFFMGEEPYYIDKLTEYIEENILEEHEKDFNQTIVYGRDVSMNDIFSAAKRYPMMADYQLVVVREAQELSRTIDDLEKYLENPQPTTILVFAYKYKTLDKRKKLPKTIAKVGVLFESKKLYENQIADWITKILASKKYTIEPKAAAMLVEFLGNDLSKISNELSKLQIILPPDTKITAKHIEDNIGISKDYNNFELQNAIGTKDILKAYKIVEYFAQNPKDNPLVVTIGVLYSYFSKLLLYHGLKDKNPSIVASALGVNPFFVKDYEAAARNYPMKKVSQNIQILRTIDMKSKGVNANALPQIDLSKELLIHIFN
jgi:DNA polymerase-3 subunit delta